MNILFLFSRPIVPGLGGIQRVTDMLARAFLEYGCNCFFLSCEEQYFGANLTCKQFFIDLKVAGWERLYLDMISNYNINVIINQGLSNSNKLILSHTPGNIKVITAYHVMPFSTCGKEKIIIKNLQPNDSIHRVLKKIYTAFPNLFSFIQVRKEIAEINSIAAYSDKFCLLSNRFYSRIYQHMPDFPQKKLCSINNPNTFVNTGYNKICVKEPIMLYVGRMSNVSKNLLQFLDVWKSLSELYPNWKAVLVGDGEDLNFNIKYAEKSGIKRVYFEGHQDNVQKYYKEASILCLTSFGEGWGMAITEAMSYGCIPCVFDTYESLYDIIDPGINGVIAKAFDTDDMVKKISNLIESPTLLKKMSLSAQEKVRKFDMNYTFPKWLSLINSIKK